MPVNINIDPSNIPGWLVVILLAAGVVAELLTGEYHERGLSTDECWALCDGAVGRWTPYECECAREVRE